MGTPLFPGDAFQWRDSVMLSQAMDVYGLDVVATFTKSSVSRVLKRENLKMRIDSIGQNSPVRKRFGLSSTRLKVGKKSTTEQNCFSVVGGTMSL